MEGVYARAAQWSACFHALGAAKTLTTIPAGSPGWVDLGTPVINVARTFCAAVAGSQVTPGNSGFGGYAMASINNDGVARAHSI